MKFKIGDKVRIIDNNIRGWNDDMVEYACGSIGIIKNISEWDGDDYEPYIEVDTSGDESCKLRDEWWYWPENLLSVNILPEDMFVL